MPDRATPPDFEAAESFANEVRGEGPKRPFEKLANLARAYLALRAQLPEASTGDPVTDTPERAALLAEWGCLSVERGRLTAERDRIDAALNSLYSERDRNAAAWDRLHAEWDRAQEGK